ncbi:MAG: trigger factor [Patescibacteria group bacterium]
MSHSHAVDFKKAFTIEELADSQVKISGELPLVELESERQAALVALGKNVTIDGFRKGNVPQAVLEKHLGEMTILVEMAERAIAHAYPHILETHNIDAIGQPKIEITKIAKGNPLGFSATVAVIPKFDLPDYKKIAQGINTARKSDEVDEAELETKIQDILRQKAAYEKLQAKAAQKTDDSLPDLPTPETAAPIVLTDELAQSLGKPGQFENIADFKQKLREHLEIEKKTDNAASHRATITDAIIEATAVTLPKILIDSEISQMFAHMQEDLDRADLKMEDYLTHIKKTKEELVAEWTPAAAKRAKLQLLLNEIARAEKITPDVEKVEAQTKELLERFKDADPTRVKLYVASVLMNEDVMQKLEAM